jgi:hypothetical protein
MMADTPAPAAPTLYRPDAYAALEPERIVDDYPFATLLSPELHATTTPMLLALLQTFGTAERHRAFVGIRPLC